ncbi:ATP-dependent DNA helicase DinG [Saccharophagus degradans]|uniref:ATP-dependent DNA helicase DinG n=1 Tax=Saccharophagus degradans TaxID=86304 RepID=A0AAW7XDA9_9GAMM|nr:ATP-dependent DNA helicase DinG [Saccharophagus degradans]MDO6424556.1 ATP-dependent DNA helicase DinG [Saccharophagus degradans]MDO6608821.1 ATP-dependent DNA helicase DinG [Saccharophagus degradans]
MLNKDVKKEIQQAYSKFLEARELKPRYGQKLMIAEIAKTLGSIQLNADGERQTEGHLCVIEAGTGTGKTVSYLLAALPVAKALGKKVVLATATVALQEQVVLKDLPDLIRYADLKFNFCLAKGRGRYMCLSKLDKILTSSDDTQFIPLYEDEHSEISEFDTKLYTSMMEKLGEGKWDGDRDNWHDEIDQPAWQRVTTDHRQCTGRNCKFVRQCAFFNARELLDEADCIVANHDLVLADLALGGGAILPAPEETIYIFDEGHHLPDKALNHFASHTRYKSTIRWLGQSEGQWSNLIEPLTDASYFTQIAAPTEAVFKNVRSLMEAHLPHMQEWVYALEASNEKDNDRFRRDDRQESSRQLRFEQGVVPAAMEYLARELVDAFLDLSMHLSKLHKELETLIEDDYPLVPRVDIETVHGAVGTWLARADGNLSLWKSYADTKVIENWPIARWITVTTFNDVMDYEIVSSPILASKALEKDLWSRCCGAVVTSATLTALNSFDRFKIRSGTYDDSHYSVVPSPFDYPNRAVLRIPSFAVEANFAADHTDSMIEYLPEIINKKAGTLVLFSSRKQMLEVFDQLPADFRMLILMQGSQSKQVLVSDHKKRIDEGGGSIIFGLASFAEGVDLPGKYCTHVIIAKIPFAVPDDPLEASLAEWVESRGGNSFMQITVPDAAMRLVQACGRLLRTESDEGVVTIMDKRLITKRYGQALLNSLPPFKRELG